MNSSDRNILRELARRKLEIANLPVNQERRALWTNLHSGLVTRPMILAEDGGIRDTDKPYTGMLSCEDEWARRIEDRLRREIWRFEELDDDHVVEPFVNTNWNVACSANFGVERVTHRLQDSSVMTSCSWDPPITDIRKDFHKLKHREFSVDREATFADKQKLEEILGDILTVRLRGSFWWTFGLTIQAIDLVGMENLMMFMYDDPEGLHQLMAFLRDDNLAYAKWLEREGLLSLNDENDYIGSGSIGYTRLLPSADFRPGCPAGTRDLWLLLESQETVGVGPEQFEEFIFPYHQSLAEHFGLVYYGCCEPLHTRWNVVRRIPRLAGCSIAPLCNQEIMAEAMKGDYVFSRKPNPTLISTETFNEDLIRHDILDTLTVAKRHGCRVELIMKDVHTLSNEPRRLARWVQIAREEIARAW
ncbi:MAG: hypothetical protein JW808_02440 [Victivallales bacterium]|nr:hypothetical protein [Victivallales bacterium]